MSTRTTFGTSFGADGLCPADAQRMKAEADAVSDATRLARLPVQVRGWGDHLDLDAMEAMSAVARLYRDEGLAPVRVSVGDLARSLKTDERDAEARLERCIRAGAVERIRKIAAAPTFRPLARNSHLPEVQIVSAKGETSNVISAAPGSLIGRYRRH